MGQIPYVLKTSVTDSTLYCHVIFSFVENYVDVVQNYFPWPFSSTNLLIKFIINVNILLIF